MYLRSQISELILFADDTNAFYSKLNIKTFKALVVRALSGLQALVHKQERFFSL